MPRTFDSGQPGIFSLTFVENVDCPNCDVTGECLFVALGESLEELLEPPTADYTCPACGTCSEKTFSGWTLYTEAG